MEEFIGRGRTRGESRSCPVSGIVVAMVISASSCEGQDRERFRPADRWSRWQKVICQLKYTTVSVGSGQCVWAA